MWYMKSMGKFYTKKYETMKPILAHLGSAVYLF